MQTGVTGVRDEAGCSVAVPSHSQRRRAWEVTSALESCAWQRVARRGPRFVGSPPPRSGISP